MVKFKLSYKPAQLHGNDRRFYIGYNVIFNIHIIMRKRLPDNMYVLIFTIELLCILFLAL